MENQFASCRAEAFPAGLRVLVVDDDPTWLKILEKMLRKCSYEVTTCGLARVALDILRERKDKFDIVISDVNMPDMDGFKLLEHVGLEMDLPVIMMSIDGETSRVMKGVQHGACDYLLKPVRMKELRNIWQHVYRKRMHEVKEIEGHNIHEDIYFLRNGPDDLEERRFFNGNDTGSMRKRKDVDTKEHADQDFNDPVTVKKARVVWSVDLHQKFVNAVNQIGFDKVGPKKILDLMNVPGLTRENVASHLQKYRLYLSRLQKQNEGRISGSMPPSDCGNKDRAGSFGIQNLKEMQQDNNVHASYLSAKFQAQEINVAGSHVDDLRDLSNSRITDNMKPLKESSYRSQKADELSQLDVIFSSKNMTPNVGNKLCDQTISEYKIRNEGRPATQFMKYPKRIHERCNLLEDFSCLPKPDQEQHFVSNQLQSTPSIIPITCNRENDTTGLLFELKPVLTDYTSGCISNISPMTWAIDPVAIQMKHDTVHCQEFGANSNSPSTKDERFEQSYDNGCPHSGHDPSVKTGIDLDLLPEDLHLFALQGIGCFKNGGMDGRDIFEDSATAPAVELIQGNWYEGSEFNCENSYDLLDYPTDEFLFAQ